MVNKRNKNQILVDKKDFEKLCDTVLKLSDTIYTDRLSNNDMNIDKKKKMVSQVHEYAITPKNSNKKGSRWSTYVTDEGSSKRKKICASYEEDFYNKLFEHYYPEFTHVDTLETLFNEVEELKLNNSVTSDGTVARNRRTWNRFYKNHPISKKPVKSLTDKDITDFFTYTINTHKLDKKAGGRCSQIMSDALNLAIDKEIITGTPYKKSCLNRSLFYPSKAELESETERILTFQDMENLFDEMWREINNNPKYAIHVLASLLFFHTGLRIGELLPLQVSDINIPKKEIYIRSSIKSEFDENKRLIPYIADSTKSKKGIRKVPLSDNAIEIFKLILNNPYRDTKSHFIFITTFKGFMTTRQVDCHLRKCAKKCGLPHSAHDIRRTYASLIFKETKDIKLVQKLLGHSSPLTTYKYVYSMTPTEEIKDTVNSILNKVNICNQRN